MRLKSYPKKLNRINHFGRLVQEIGGFVIFLRQIFVDVGEAELNIQRSPLQETLPVYEKTYLPIS